MAEVTKVAQSDAGTPVSIVVPGSTFQYAIGAPPPDGVAQGSYQVIDTFPSGVQGVLVISATSFTSVSLSGGGFSAAVTTSAAAPSALVVQVGLVPSTPAGTPLTNTVRVDPNGTPRTAAATITAGGG